MRRPIFLAALSCAVLLCGALHAQPAAEVISMEAAFTMTSPTEGRYEVRQRIRVNEEKGQRAASFVLFTDEFRTLSAFSGSISSGGKVLRKLRKQDLAETLHSDALAEKIYLNGYEPVAPFPFEVEYSYTVTYRKAIASFPTFMPVPDYDVPVRSAVYEVAVPAASEVRYKASAEPVRQARKGMDVLRWEFRDFPGFSHETGMPDANEFVPYVYSCPVEFQYAGSSGSQHDWSEIGRWLAMIMPADPEVPAPVRAEVEALTQDCTTDLQKVRVLYDYLREHTRYVSIQLGIGGFVPLSPQRVASSGFGDCKALSFYLQRLLALVGVDSEYLIVSTERSELLPGYASVGQMNHAMLCVPLQQDTLWVECTNPLVPLGYRHADIAGHQAVLIRPQGGQAVRIRDYPDSLRSESERQEIRLAPDGSARVTVSRTARLDRAERFIGFASLKASDAERFLFSGLQGNHEDYRLLDFSDNFRAYDGRPSYVPEARVRFSFGARGLGRVNGDRMFVKSAPFARAMISQKTARKYDLLVRHGSSVRDSVQIFLPEGYSVEHLPEDQTVSSPLADFRQEFRQLDSAIVVVSEVRMRAGRMHAEDYPQFRDLVKSVNKAYESTLVLKKNP